MADILRITRDDARYPEALNAVAGMPDVLYVRGNAELLSRPGIAVVGTRRMSEYGRQAARQMSEAFVRAGFTVISGLALGVDAVAHRAALDAGGATVAVLGSGVDDAMVGPRQNLPLARDILSHGGLLVSEYPPGSPADRWTFPARNRIISGLSKGVLIVEADIKSGALITARLAGEQGRDVFAVPGGIYWPRSAGTNYLIQQGAKAVCTPADVLEEYGVRAGAAMPVSTSDPVHARIVAILEDGPKHMDDIVAASGMTAAQIVSALSIMELDGTVANADGTFRIS
ncbi:MAG TPA: DNA-processing protein DprA [Candidatus Paceibacterota bacterium]|nr:DNA-processing protein DprA [Candidatus Paceibacterota bacterium]